MGWLVKPAEEEHGEGLAIALAFGHGVYVGPAFTVRLERVGQVARGGEGRG